MRTVRAADGRRLSVATGGDADGKPVVVCHGTPGSGLLLEPWLEHAASAGVHLIAYDRPGYGGSAAQGGRTIASCADDVRAIAFSMGLRRVAVWGISGGGPHALACAALMPDLVCAAATLGSIAPSDALGDSWADGMGEANVEEYTLYRKDPTALKATYGVQREAMLDMTSGQVIEAIGSLVSPEEAAGLRGGLDAYFVSSVQDGLVAGVEGWWDDTVADMSPWDFDLSTIEVPVQVWHGRHDQFVPIRHGEWLIEHVPGSMACLSETDAHLTLLNRLPEIHAWLLGHF
jgi:pimeloyl-ACP methyl ester carboxylesterase